MENNNLIKYESGLVKQVGNAITVTNKLLSLTEPELIPYRKGDKWGFCTEDKKIVIDCGYQHTSFFKNGLAKVKLNDKTGYIDKKQNIIIPFIYDYGQSFCDGFAFVKIKKEEYYINTEGTEIKKCNFNPFRAEMRKTFDEEGKWGFINKEKEVVFPFRYEEAHWFKERVAGVKLNDKWGFIDENENNVIPFIYDNVFDYHEELARVEKDNKWGLIDKVGRTVIPFIYDDFQDFFKGIAVVTKNNRSSYIDNKGK